MIINQMNREQELKTNRLLGDKSESACPVRRTDIDIIMERQRQITVQTSTSWQVTEYFIKYAEPTL